MNKIINLYKKYEEIIRYVIIGALTTIVSLGVYYLSTILFLNPNSAIELQIANIISWVCAVLFAYITNRIFVFKSNNQKKLNEFIKFVTARLSTLLLEMLFMFILVTVININDKISKLIVQFIVLITNYILSKLFVFKK